MTDLRDHAVPVTDHGTTVIHRGHRGLDVVELEVTLPGTERPNRLDYELLRVGPVAAVLPYDPARDQILLIRQFRVGAHAATGLGANVEIIAGRVDPGEEVIAAARREALEEGGVPVEDLVEMLAFTPVPAASDEFGTLFLGRADLSAVPKVTGLAHEGEVILPFAVPVDDALAALAAGSLRNGYLILALQWLALNREAVRARWAPAT